MLSRLRQRKGLIIGIAVILTLAALVLAPWAPWHAGREKMRGVPFDGPIPAIFRTARPNHLAYYFAGDFADSPARQKAYRYRWQPEIRALFGVENRDDLQAVYWRIYAPIMQRIIRDAVSQSRHGLDPKT